MVKLGDNEQKGSFMENKDKTVWAQNSQIARKFMTWPIALMMSRFRVGDGGIAKRGK